MENIDGNVLLELTRLQRNEALDALNIARAQVIALTQKLKETEEEALDD